MGTPFYPLGQRIKDTIAVHGIQWTANHYRGLGLSCEQFMLLAKGAKALG